MQNRDEHADDEAQAAPDERAPEAAADTPVRDDDRPEAAPGAGEAPGGEPLPAFEAGVASAGDGTPLQSACEPVTRLVDGEAAPLDTTEADDPEPTLAGSEPPAEGEAARAPLAEPASGEASEGVDVPAPEESAGARAAFEGVEGEEEPTLPPQEVRAIVEALVFASPQPVTPRQIGQVLGAVSKKEWQTALEELKGDYAADGRGLQLVEVAGGWQITTRPEYNDWVRELLDPKTPTRLSIQALETLAVIAYKQPVTLPEVIALRGVKSGGVIKTLLEKRLIRITGRKEVVGRPMLYGTTKEFLLHFGLKDLGELPKIEEFAEVLGEEVDVAGLKKAIEAPTPVDDVPLAEAEPDPAAETPDDAGAVEAAETADSEEDDGA